MKKKGLYARLANYFQHEIWSVTDRGYFASRLNRFFRVLYIAGQGFVKDDCPVKASALTFYSLLSIVPVFAMVFGIAKGFGYEQSLENLLRDKLNGKEEVIEQVMSFAHSMLANTQGGLIAGVGMLVLLWSVMRVMISIEAAFNSIWNVRLQRPPLRKLSDYLSLMFLMPIMFIVSNSTTIYISKEISRIATTTELLHSYRWLVELGLKILPLSLVWFMFAILYAVMPNTKVKFKNAITSGIIAGIIFQLVLWAYIKFQIGMSQNNAVYGSFAAVPLFLVWMQTSWLIILLGAEISYAIQHTNQFEADISTEDLSPSDRLKLSLLVMACASGNYLAGQPALTRANLSERLKVSTRLVSSIVSLLQDCKLLYRIKTEKDDVYGYIPAVDPHTLDVWTVWQKLQLGKPQRESVVQAMEFSTAEEIIESISLAVQHSDKNILVKNIQLPD